MIISKEELREMEVEVFEGQIIVIDQADQVEEACKVLMQSDIIGFDTETKPAFKKGIVNQVALLQLSTENVCYLFRLNKTDIPQCIMEVLSDKNIKKIGLSLKDDFSVLRKSGTFSLNGFVDIQGLVAKYGIQELSLQKIYAILFNKRITKGQRLTNWEANELTDAQQMYAAIDAWACLKIYRELGKRTPVE